MTAIGSRWLLMRRATLPAPELRHRPRDGLHLSGLQVLGEGVRNPEGGVLGPPRDQADARSVGVDQQLATAHVLGPVRRAQDRRIPETYALHAPVLPQRAVEGENHAVG